MKLYLVQHGDALPKDADPERPLSAKGRADAAKMAAFLQSAEVSVDEVVHSGKTRAEETATLLAQAVWPGHKPLKMDGLAPNDSTDHLAHATGAAGGDVMAVGHMPFMGRMAARCLSGSEEGTQVAFEPGTVVCLERTGDGAQGDWALCWMLRPSMIP